MSKPILRELIESEDYLDQLEKLGAQETDERLRGIMWSLTLRAEEWPVVEGFKRLRLAKTDLVRSGGKVKPRLQVWFEIRDSHHVDLLYLDQDDED
ncbi:MAG: hypothetical protein LAO77_07660 [Acidobacteriia bacterium]|nr:hypothetical protein [Terriglobia bacterium]